jgi:GPH family glycoside/pentoside/hexuronide:cation symporter
VAAAHVLPWSIMPDAIEWDEWQTGERHEGMFYSLITLAHKIAVSIAIPLVMFVLEFTGYVRNSAAQPASALAGLRIAIGPIPAVLLCAGIVFAALYPLSKSEFARVRAELERRRARQKEQET